MKITPHLVLGNAAAAIDFYKRVFDAHEIDRYVDHKLGDRIVHATIRIGDSEVSLSDENHDGRKDGPRALGGSPVILSLAVADADAVGERMVAAGAKVIYPIADQFYGERQGRLEDPFGHLWIITQRLKELTREEIQAGVDAYQPDPS
jgi:PhnB protein